LEKRYEYQKYDQLLQSIEKTTGDSFTDLQRKILVKGASERDLVLSGLEETMVKAYQSMNELRKEKKIESLRTAAFMLALQRISSSYLSLGIFP